VALYHDYLPDLNYWLALSPPLARAAIIVGSAKRKFKFGKIIMI
jgi:hypothetical protein